MYGETGALPLGGHLGQPGSRPGLAEDAAGLPGQHLDRHALRILLQRLPGRGQSAHAGRGPRCESVRSLIPPRGALTAPFLELPAPAGRPFISTKTWQPTTWQCQKALLPIPPACRPSWRRVSIQPWVFRAIQAYVSQAVGRAEQSTHRTRSTVYSSSAGMVCARAHASVTACKWPNEH